MTATDLFQALMTDFVDIINQSQPIVIGLAGVVFAIFAACAIILVAIWAVRLFL